MSEFWHDFISLWDWAADEGGLINYVIAAVITGMLIAVIAAIGYGIFLGGRLCFDHLMAHRTRVAEAHLQDD